METAQDYFHSKATGDDDSSCDLNFAVILKIDKHYNLGSKSIFIRNESASSLKLSQ